MYIVDTREVVPLSPPLALKCKTQNIFDMEKTSNKVVNSFLAQGAQGSFLSIANRNGENLSGEHSFTCSEQVAAIRKGRPYTTRDNRTVDTYDALMRIQLGDKPGFYLVGARQLGLQPSDFLSESEQESDQPLMKWPSCKGSITLTLVTKDREGQDIASEKQYYRIAVSLKN